MADQNDGNPIDAAAAGDRVAMLTLNSDGSVRQRNPQLIGDKDVALAATREQFRQQAVSAADQKLRGVGDTTPTEPGEPDPMVAAIAEGHDAALKSADAAAEAAVEALWNGPGGTDLTGTATQASNDAPAAPPASGSSGAAKSGAADSGASAPSTGQ